MFARQAISMLLPHRTSCNKRVISYNSWTLLADLQICMCRSRIEMACFQNHIALLFKVNRLIAH